MYAPESKKSLLGAVDIESDNDAYTELSERFVNSDVDAYMRFKCEGKSINTLA